MEGISALFKNLAEQFQELSQGRKAALVALMVAGVASLFVMILWVQAPDFQLLYANLTQEDAASIVEELKTQNIPYELGAGGALIRVPTAKVHEIRLQLAAKGLPEGGEVGLEIFEEATFGMTEFIQKLNFQRALQGELVRTIKSLEAIDQVRIHLVIPEESLFLREKPKGKASVTVKIKAGRTLSESQVQGIVHVVSSSVKGVPPENVVVVDLKGNILSGVKGSSEAAMVTSTNFKFRRRLETDLEASIKKMLEDALGEGKVIARVAAELNFDKTNRTEEIYDPDSQVVRSEQRTTESVLGAVPPGGVPGVQALLPAGETAGGGPGSAAKRNKEKQTLNYEINKVIRHVARPPGQIKKLSVSVMVDGTVNENGEYQARSSEEMTQYLNIIKTAVGFDEDRGDDIKVENMQFDKTFLIEQEKRIREAEKNELIFQVAKYLLGVIFIVLFFSKVIRPIVNFMTTQVEVVPEGGPELLPTEEEMEEEKKRLTELGPVSQEIRKNVGDFVDGDPQFAASIVRKWLREKKPND